MTDTANIKCVIIDDEPLAVTLLADYVKRSNGLQVLFAGTNVMHALDLVQGGQADLLFLDIQMPELTGIQFMKIIRNSCDIIITSAYTQYAIDGFEHNVLDYLLKPVTYERFVVAVNKFRHKRISENAPIVLKEIPDHIFIRTSNRLQRMDLKDIFYIEGLRDYIAFHSVLGKTLSLESMKNILALLPPEQFVRIHKSYIVNKSKILFVEKGGVNINNTYLPIGDTYREEFMNSVRKT
ncbi:LytR/AlgR family response regulator transcription factor [Flavitalea sp.]|nr:LytTR family DNA-binding domain-containing protein [Flavitalea sp.]